MRIVTLVLASALSAGASTNPTFTSDTTGSIVGVGTDTPTFSDTADGMQFSLFGNYGGTGLIVSGLAERDFTVTQAAEFVITQSATATEWADAIASDGSVHIPQLSAGGQTVTGNATDSFQTLSITFDQSSTTEFLEPGNYVLSETIPWTQVDAYGAAGDVESALVFNWTLVDPPTPVPEPRWYGAVLLAGLALLHTALRQHRAA